MARLLRCTEGENLTGNQMTCRKSVKAADRTVLSGLQ